jgi:Domain of unknown function (DUF5655)
MGVNAMQTIGDDEAAFEIYRALVAQLGELGPFNVETKMTSLHITHGRAFLGVHPRKGALVLNLVLLGKLEDPRIRRSERVSANRWHNELLVTKVTELDEQLAGWIAEAYAATE